MDSSGRGVVSVGGIEESPTVAAVQDGHFAEPPRHDRVLTESGREIISAFRQERCKTYLVAHSISFCFQVVLERLRSCPGRTPTSVKRSGVNSLVRGESITHLGQAQREVCLRQLRDHVPHERLIVRDLGLAVGRPEKNPKRELRGSGGCSASPPATVPRVPGDGRRLGGIEPSAGEVGLARLPMALDHAKHGHELVTA